MNDKVADKSTIEKMYPLMIDIVVGKSTIWEIILLITNIG